MASAIPTRGAPSFVYTEPVAPQPTRSTHLHLRQRGLKASAEEIITKILTCKALSGERLSNIAKWKAYFDKETDPEKILKLLGYLVERLLTLEGASVKEQIDLMQLAEQVKEFLSLHVQPELEEFLEGSVRDPLLKREETLAKVDAIFATFKEERAALRTVAVGEVAKIKTLYSQAKVRIVEVADNIGAMDAEMEGVLTKTMKALESSLKSIERVVETEEDLSERADGVIAATDLIAEQGFNLLNGGMKG